MSDNESAALDPSVEFDSLVAQAIEVGNKELGVEDEAAKYLDESQEGTESEVTETTETPEVTETPAEKSALERVTAREAALAAKEKELEDKLNQYRKESQNPDKFDIKELSSLGNKSPKELLNKLGLDQEFVMDVLIAEKLGDKAPPALKEKLRDYQLRKEIDSIRAERDNERRVNETRAYYDRVSNEVLKYVTEGIDEKKTPVSSAVAKTDSAFVQQLVLQEMERDARVRVASGETDGELLSYSDAVVRIEKMFAVVEKALAGKNASGDTNGKKPAAGLKPVPPVTKAKAKPLDEFAQLEEKGLEEALRTYHKLEAKRR